MKENSLFKLFDANNVRILTTKEVSREKHNCILFTLLPYRARCPISFADNETTRHRVKFRNLSTCN